MGAPYIYDISRLRVNAVRIYAYIADETALTTSEEIKPGKLVRVNVTLQTFVNSKC